MSGCLLSASLFAYIYEYDVCVGFGWAGRSSLEKARKCRFPGVSSQQGPWDLSLLLSRPPLSQSLLVKLQFLAPVSMNMLG